MCIFNLLPIGHFELPKASFQSPPKPLTKGYQRILKVGYVFFQKRFRKPSRAEYQNKLEANQQ